MEYDFQKDAQEHTQVQEMIEPSYQDLQDANAQLVKEIDSQQKRILNLETEIATLVKEQFSAKGIFRSAKDVWSSLEFHSPITFKKERESR